MIIKTNKLGKWKVVLAIASRIAVTATQSCAQPQQFSLQGKEYRFENDKWYTFFQGKKGDEIIPQRLVVRLKNRGQIEVFDFDRLNINGISFGSSRFLNGYYVLLIEQYQDPFNIASALEKSGEFDVLLFDALGKRQCAPDDQSYSTQWNLPIIHMATAWNISVGHSSVLLAIIDSGIDYDHEDLDGNIWVNPAEDINGNGIPDFYSVNQGGDLDGQDAPGDINQKIDDLIGWDFAGDGNDPQPPYQEDFDPDDTDGHGTNVAGISSAQTHNYENGTYRGIAGVAGGWESQNGVSLMVLRDGGEFPIHSLTAQAIEYAAKNGAQVINISTGFSNNWQDVRDAINLAVNNYDVVVVASVGNYGDTGNPSIRYPAKYSNTIAVGATDDNDNRYGYSSYGSEMDVMAPSDVPTTAMGGGYDNNFTGTSASAPHVAGLAGLIRSIDPSLNWTEVRDILRNTADEVPGMGGQNFTNMYGYGRINAREALLGSGAQVNSGAVTQNTTWNGNIIVEGDITVGSSYTLTIQSGTNVVLNNFCDSESSGEETGKAEIIIYGQLDVLGTDVNPVTLKNVIESNVYHWGQIYIGSGGRATIEYADFEDPVRAIKAVSAELVTIDNSTIRGSFDTAIIFESCLSISNRIRDCLIENNEYNGIWLNYSRGSVIGNTVRGNSGIGITGFYGPYFDVSDNIVYNNSGYGVKAFADGSTSIINNTIDSNYGGLMLANPYGETINIINNIISDNDGGGGGINGGGYSENYYNIEYNDVWSNTGGNYTGGISDQTNQNDNISENPDFVGGNPYDYHLQYTSPCIDTGDPNYPADPDGSIADIGAYYYPRPNPPQNLTVSQYTQYHGGRQHKHPKLTLDPNQENDMATYNAWRKLGSQSWSVAASITHIPGEQHTWIDYLYEYVFGGSTILKYHVTGVNIVPQESDPSNDVTAKTGTGGKASKTVTSYEDIPKEYQLSQNFPNPFNPETSINYALPEASYVMLTVFDITGKEVKNLLNSYQNSGYKSIMWSGKDDRGIDVPSGMYFYRLQVRSTESNRIFQQVRKMIILR